jgi:hypothetical protein
MDAESSLPPASRAGVLRSRAAARAAAVACACAVGALLAAAAPALAAAHGPDGSPGAVPPLSKPSAAAKRVAPTHAWHDGTVVRALTIEPRLRADFSPGSGRRGPALRESAGMLKDVSPALQSPVLRDEAGRARALPGGVLVTLAGVPDEATARALLARHGATAVRRLASGTWLVETPAGLAALELSNRLAATGAFASAQPNWWVERALK